MAGSVPLRRLPLAPLEAFTRHEMTSFDLAAACGVQPSLWRRWRTTGVTLWQADRLAVALGEHPLTIWPEWLDPEYDSIGCRKLTLDDEETAA